MKRREFLKRSVPLTAAPIYLSGVPISAMTESANLAALTNAGSLSDRCLVLVFLAKVTEYLSKEGVLILNRSMFIITVQLL